MSHSIIPFRTYDDLVDALKAIANFKPVIRKDGIETYPNQYQQVAIFSQQTARKALGWREV